MWGLPGKLLCTLLLMECAYVCMSAEETTTTKERRGFMIDCRNFGISRECLEASKERYISEEKEVLEGDSKKMNSLPDRKLTEYLGEIEGRDRKRRRQQKHAIRMIMLMSAIAAKTAAVATAAAIMIPLALKAITLLAAKSLIVGKLAVMLVSIIGFLKLVNQPPDHKTEVIYTHQRMDPSKMRPIDRGSPTIKAVTPPFNLL